MGKTSIDVLDMTKEEQQLLFTATLLLDQIMENHPNMTLRTFINDKKKGGIISIYYSNSSKTEG